MNRLESLDVTLFRWVNVGLKNAFFDWFLPLFNSNVLFVPVLAILAIWILWEGSLRGRLFVVFMLLTFIVGDPLIVHTLKDFIDRPRPFAVLNDIHLLVGKTRNPSMPSGHAANWFAAAVVCFVFYRWTVWFMLPMALIEAFSRVYLGVHYPSDVLAGSMIGCAYAVTVLWVSNAVWGMVGPRWFPIWHAALPRLIPPLNRGRPDAWPSSGEAGSGEIVVSAAEPTSPVADAGEVRRTSVSVDRHWLRLAYVLIVAVAIGHLIYIAAGRIELSEDEAYQWLWSKHLALSYFSKPPLIAYTQALGTTLFGDTVFGIRFFAPVLAAITSLVLVRFLAREANGFVAFLSVLVATATPLLMVGSTLLTIDSLSVLFWMAAVASGWIAVRNDSTRAWVWTGLWMGLGFLSKYVALFQWICWAVVFVLWPQARNQLRRPGPYLAMLVNALCMIPVVVWNVQHDWITLAHLADRGGLQQAWRPTLRYFWDFIAAESLLLNPVFFIGAIWAAVAWRARHELCALGLYLVSMGAPLFLFYLLYTLRARVQPNWIGPAVLPLFAWMLIYWEARWRRSSAQVVHWLFAGMTLGWLVVVPLHDTRLAGKLIGKELPPKLDPLRRVLGWKETARTVNQARTDLLDEGKPVFIIGGHYGTASLLTFYIDEAKAGVPDQPLIYYLSSEKPKNQFYFWPGYEGRKGQNAIYVAEVDRVLREPPANLTQEFASVTNLGTRDLLHHGRVLHRIQLFACRDLR